MKKSLLLLSLLGCSAMAGAAPFINEIHYDDAGADAGEGVEVASTGSEDLSGWTLVPYNGNNGQTYSVTNLSGVFSEGNRTFWFPISGLQNGAPDGVALVNDLNVVVEFISYEGVVTATNGPANGQMSTDIGVAESNTTLDGTSLQRSDDGTGAAVWAASATATPGANNNGQGMLPVELQNFSVE